MKRLPRETLENAISVYESMIRAYENYKVDEDECNIILDKVTVNLLKELQEYRSLEEQGLLLKLPLKVGDKFYLVEDGYIYDFKADEITIRKENGKYIFCMAYMDFEEGDFGKTVFLTKEEAEKALEKMGE